MDLKEAFKDENVVREAIKLLTKKIYKYNPKDSVNSQQSIIDIVTLDLCQLEEREKVIENVFTFYLNAKNKIISKDRTSGSVSTCVLYPRNIASKAIELGAVAVVVAHNHPSGEVKPSHADMTITKKLWYGLKYLDMTLLDHLIIGNNRHYSFYEEGVFENYERNFREEL